MIVNRALTCLALSLWASVGAAGPWPRDEGGHFLSLSVEQDRDANRYGGLYGEYGWRARTTLGYELGRTNLGETSAMIWVQRALDDGEGPNRFVVSAGSGGLWRDDQLVPTVQLGAGWGRGFASILGGGWITAELQIKAAGETEGAVRQVGNSRVETFYLTPRITTKADVTVGLRPWDRIMIINQLRLEQRPDDPVSARLASSVVGEVAGPLKLELGTVTPLSGPAQQAFRIGAWIEF